MDTKILACLIMLAIPAASAHAPSDDAVLEPGTYLHHTVRHEGSLEPGAWNNTTLAYGGTHLQGWWFLLWSGQVEGGALEATVVHHDRAVHEWTWQEGEEELIVHRLDGTGFYELRLHNPGPEPVHYSLYYDNTCDCTSKIAQGATSPLWFNYNLTAAGPVGWEVSVVPYTDPDQELPPGFGPVGNVSVSSTVATWDGPGDAWPEDFQVVQTVDRDLPPKGDEPLWTLDLGFTAEHAGTNYILLTLDHDGDPEWRFQVRPDLPESLEAPGVGLVVLLGAVLVAALLVRWTGARR